MKLHSIPNIPGSTHRPKRLGVGVGTGHGKTCGRGHKGGKARAGYSVRPGFEGGQMPLCRRLPHRGFNNADYRIEYAVVNVGDLIRFRGQQSITREHLVEAGLVRRSDLRVKILGEGSIDFPITVTVDRFSASAKTAIEKAGGKAVELAPRPAEEN